MRIFRLIPPVAALCAVSLLYSNVRGFTLLGGSLDLSQRDFRIHNNFADPEANNNQVPNPDFPGALGAELAIWKGVAEWGSRAHGTGSTDPLQSDGIGSGQSNFDAFYVGEHTSPAGTNGNVISALPGTSFITAFTEVPIGDGWRIRFFEDPSTWNDGPGLALEGPEAFDIQGTACHEFGHALGLDHSTDPEATMFAAVPATGEELRSIESDDMAGVQFLYGALSPIKPRIDDYELSGGQVTLIGENFDVASNDVWFSQLVAGTTDGTPIMVQGQPSTALGTRLTVTIPAGAGPGDIAVRLPGDAPDQLSNAFPFDPAFEPFFEPTIFYGAGSPFPNGDLPELSIDNLASVSAGTITMDIGSGPFFGTGIVFSGSARAEIPIAGGTLLIQGPYRREAVFQFNLTTATVDVPIPASAQVGEERFYQVYMIDSAQSGFALSRAVRFVFVP